jgi:hypothetical protein
VALSGHLSTSVTDSQVKIAMRWRRFWPRRTSVEEFRDFK